MTYIYNTSKQKIIRRNLRKQIILAEKLIWSRIRNRKIKYKFKRQFGVGKFILDFYCSEIKLGIEIDGATHATDEEIKNDLLKEKYLENFNIKVIRYTNSDVYKNIDSVIEDIYYNCIMRREEMKNLTRPLLIKERGKNYADKTKNN